MRCAAELLNIKAIAVEEEKVRQRKLDEIARVEYLGIVEKTVSFCEKLSDFFEKKALNREVLYHSFRVKMERDRLGNTLAYMLVEEPKAYANGDSSYSVDKTQVFSYDALKELLAEYCYNVTSEAASYKCYGAGNYACRKVIISIAE